MSRISIPRAAVILLAAVTGSSLGCRSADSITAPATGSLEITVSGLAGAAAAITVTGPSGYAQLVTASTTLSSLVPGSYTVAALNVWASTATYGPMPSSQTIQVSSPTTAAIATVTYAILPSGWANEAPMPKARFLLSGGVVNGVLYAIGGSSSNPPPMGTVLSTVEAYDPATNTWTTKAAMPTSHIDLATGVVNGILYAAGGNAGAGAQNTTEAFTP